MKNIIDYARLLNFYNKIKLILQTRSNLSTQLRVNYLKLFTKCFKDGLLIPELNNDLLVNSYQIPH